MANASCRSISAGWTRTLIETLRTLIHGHLPHGPITITALCAARRSRFALIAQRTSIARSRIAIAVHSDISL